MVNTFLLILSKDVLKTMFSAPGTFGKGRGAGLQARVADEDAAETAGVLVNPRPHCSSTFIATACTPFPGRALLMTPDFSLGQAQTLS
jgi:hypothetical protein